VLQDKGSKQVRKSLVHCFRASLPGKVFETGNAWTAHRKT
jgi:hypothetical protein